MSAISTQKANGNIEPVSPSNPLPVQIKQGGPGTSAVIALEIKTSAATGKVTQIIETFADATTLTTNVTNTTVA